MKFQIFQKKLSLSSVALFTFVSFGIYVRYLLLDSPIIPYALKHKILPNINLSPLEIILSKFHPELAHWRIIVTNFIYNAFGLTGITYRIFPFIISIATLYFIYTFSKKRIGENEAILAVLLFGTSYYSYWSITWPHFPAFYFLASLLTIHFLWLGVQYKVGHKYWLLFTLVIFLNLTNVILPFLFLPPVFFVGIWLIWSSNRQDEPEIAPISLYKKFLFYFFLSIALALIFYQLKGVNILKNAYELLINGKFIDPILAPIPGQEYFEFTSGRLEKLNFLAKSIFITFNFYAGDMGMQGNKLAYGWFLFLFLLGQFKLYKTHPILFITFSIIFFPQVLLLSLGMNLDEERFLGFILPFYLISIASGFCFLLSKVLYFLNSKLIKDAITYFSAFIIFAYLIHTKPIWDKSFLDNVFQTKGIVTITDYLEKKLNPNDIILNVTNITELRGEVGDALNLSSYALYLEKFLKQNRLGLLPGKKGSVGIWLILQKPLDLKNGYLPFYFPPKLKLKLIKTVKGSFLYFGEINMPDLTNPQNASFIKNPFWSFITAHYFQNQENYPIAKLYYQKMIRFGYNTERAYYNLGVIHTKLNPKEGLKFFLKALQILEEPTLVPENAKIFTFLPKKTRNRGMAANFDEMKNVQPMKYFWEPVGAAKRKVWIKDSLLEHLKGIYFPFYFSPGIVSYTLFDILGDENNYQIAKNLLYKGSEINPDYLPLIKNLLDKKLRNVASKTQIGSIAPMGLVGIHQHFPPIKN